MSYDVETLDFWGDGKIVSSLVVISDDEVQIHYAIDTAGATAGAALVYDGANVVWSSPVSDVDFCFAFMMGGS